MFQSLLLNKKKMVNSVNNSVHFYQKLIKFGLALAQLPHVKSHFY